MPLFQFRNYNMLQVSKIQERKDRITNIRKSLMLNPILSATTTLLQLKLQKNRSRKPSATFTSKQLTLSKVWSDEQDIETDNKFPSLFKDKYDIGEKIGEGAHGVVKKCYCKETGQLYAVKTISLDRQHIIFLKRNFIDIKQLKHAHIIGYKQLFFQMKNETCHLVMDYLPFPDLLSITIESQDKLKDLIYQVLQTLQYLHEHKVCHRDIKPQNILYDEDNNNIILIDFGISKKLIDRGRKKEMLTLTGTPYYRAPEMFEGGGYDQMVDMWALGVTIYKLMTGVTPFQSQYHSETIANIMKGEYSYSQQIKNKYSKSIRNLISRFLKKKSERLRAEQAMKDMYFMDFYKNQDEFTRSLTLNQKNGSLFGPLGIYNNSLLPFNSIKGKDKTAKFNLKESSSMKEWIEQDESNIYGCDEQQKKSLSSRPSFDHSPL